MGKLPSVGTHAGQLERWLGRELVEGISERMRDWYGPPIAVGGVPGRVYAHAGGDFRGPILEGRFATALDHARGVGQRLLRAYRRVARSQLHSVNAIANFDDVVAALAAGRRFDFFWQKAGSTGVVSGTNSLWGLGNQPAAGANASNAPGGDALTDANAAAPSFTNPSSGTSHILNAWANATIAGNTLLLYDRLFQVNKTMASTANESVTGVPTRYQSSTGGAADSSEGNFLFVEVGGTALAATAHNWDNCTYTDQGGTTAVTLPTITGNSGAIVRRLDHPIGQWFAPLASGDTGVKALTNMHCSASVATGVINFVIGHPLIIIPCPVINTSCMVDGLNTAASLARMFDDAALALLEILKPATTATTYNVQVTAAHG